MIYYNILIYSIYVKLSVHKMLRLIRRKWRLGLAFVQLTLPAVNAFVLTECRVTVVASVI